MNYEWQTTTPSYYIECIVIVIGLIPGFLNYVSLFNTKTHSSHIIGLARPIFLQPRSPTQIVMCKSYCHDCVQIGFGSDLVYVYTMPLGDITQLFTKLAHPKNALRFDHSSSQYYTIDTLMVSEPVICNQHDR